MQQRTTRGARESTGVVVTVADLVPAAAVNDLAVALVADPESEELHTLRSQKAEASQKIAHLDVEVSELRMAADSAKVSSFVHHLRFNNLRPDYGKINSLTCVSVQRGAKHAGSGWSSGRGAQARTSGRGGRRAFRAVSRRKGQFHQEVSQLQPAAKRCFFFVSPDTP